MILSTHWGFFTILGPYSILGIKWFFQSFYSPGIFHYTWSLQHPGDKVILSTNRGIFHNTWSLKHPGDKVILPTHRGFFTILYPYKILGIKWFFLLTGDFSLYLVLTNNILTIKWFFLLTGDFSGLGTRSFQKNATFLRSFPFFIKERNILFGFISHTKIANLTKKRT